MMLVECLLRIHSCIQHMHLQSKRFLLIKNFKKNMRWQGRGGAFRGHTFNIPGPRGTLLPQNSTVSFKNELGKQWYWWPCWNWSSEDKSFWQLSFFDACVHWLTFPGQEVTLCTHFGKTDASYGVKLTRII